MRVVASFALLPFLSFLSCTPPAAPPACDDGLRNGDETDIDCGGSCKRCTAGGACAADADCDTAVCLGATCRNPACDDARKDGNETDIDCGGTCDPCVDGARCGNGADCVSGACTAGTCTAPTCDDDVTNGAESDIDCGGPTCSACPPDAACRTPADCLQGVCVNDRCAEATCDDEVQNMLETDVDCGGGEACPPCMDGLGCDADADCLSNVCDDGTCLAPTCDDAHRNGDETDMDCGGSCDGCGPDLHCDGPGDCLHGVCLPANNTCAAPSCGDDTRNGDETDVDCGGSCGDCLLDRHCLVGDDCGSGRCVQEACVPAQFPNGDFEADPPGTSGDDLTGWRVEAWNGGPPAAPEHRLQASATIMEGQRFRLDRALRSSVRNVPGSGNGDPSGRSATQWIRLENPYPLRGDTLWLRRSAVMYDTAGLYAWALEVTFEASGVEESVRIACRSWGNNEGCAGNTFDSALGSITGADGAPWFLHAVTVPPSMRGRPVTVGLRHWQDSWDGTTASSQVLFDFLDDGPWCAAEETCGGACAACEDGLRCFNDADCAETSVCLAGRCVGVAGRLPNGGFEFDAIDPAEVVAGWRARFQTSNDAGVPGTGPNVYRELGVRDGLSFEGARSIRSLLRNVNGGGGGDTQTRHATLRLDATTPVSTGAAALLLHRRPVTYTTSSRWAWSIGVEFDDGSVGASVLLACACWGNGEGCAGNGFDSSTGMVPGVVGDWARHVVTLPANLDRSRVRVTLWHHQDSWDGTTAESEVHFDGVSYEAP